MAHTPRVLNVRGFPGAEISDVRIYHPVFRRLKQPDVIQDADVRLADCTLLRADRGFEF